MLTPVTRRIALTALALFIAASASQAATIGSRFDPNDYASNGDGNFATGSVTFDTDLVSFFGDNGVGTGQVVTSESGNVEMVLYNFDSLTVASGVAVTIFGNRGVVISSMGDIDLNAQIRVSGTVGSGNAVGTGGPGAEGGVRNTSFSSNPPGTSAGNGGDDGAGSENHSNGVGFGGGSKASVGNAAYGGGYGGYGRRAGGTGSAQNSLIGSTYGDAMLTDLYGGSGGGGSKSGSNANDSSGGGGGGAIELTALGTILLRGGGDIFADGGNGFTTTNSDSDRGSGGGSGGGIMLNAPTVDIRTGTMLSVDGGNGGNGNTQGGGGGGGRIAIYTDNLILADGKVIDNHYDIAGGLRGTAVSGKSPNGSFYQAAFIPEPATMSLLMIGGAAVLARRRRRRA